MSDLPHIILNSQADRRIKKGHLWLYSNEVDIKKTPLKALEAGQLAIVSSAKGQALGKAFINPNALICGRLITRQVDRVINQGFFKFLIGRALTLREAFFPKPYYRLVYGDADFLPGLVIDRYGDHLVLQVSIAGLMPYVEQIMGACVELMKPKGMILKNNHSALGMEGLEDSVVTHGDLPDLFQLEENNTLFQVPSATGQKTGWFYDHRVNRQFMQQCVKGKNVLDVFSYVGGWGVQAAQAGASQVTCVDASAQAIDGVVDNAKLNGKQDSVTAIQGKAIDVLKSMVEEKARFDVVILDPPAFIKKRKDQKSGEAAYRHLNELAVRLLDREGILVSASCSRPLTQDTLKDIVRASARHLDRQAQLLYTGGQGPDHPVHPTIPETEYLKAQFYRITHT